jgi:hypothetical protein
MCSICGVMLQLRFQTTAAMDAVLRAVFKSSSGRLLSFPRTARGEPCSSTDALTVDLLVVEMVMTA